MKVLLVEDERDLAEATGMVLQKNHYAVELAFDGQYALDCALTGMHDLIILDIMLPKMDGLSVLTALRSAGIATPVLLLTARGEVRDKVTGLDHGADDYLPKPFHMDELLARLRALGRRQTELRPEGAIMLGTLSFNPLLLTLSGGGVLTRLTLKESHLLELLLAHEGRFVSKNTIIEKLWGYDADVPEGLVESQVSLLRKKLTAADSGFTVKVARGVGYRLERETDV